MDKTVKELSEQYGMSKQAISYHIKKLPKEYKIFDTKNGVKTLIVNEKGQEILREMLSNKVSKEVENFGSKELVEIQHELELKELENKHLKEKIDFLESEKKEWKEHIEWLNSRLEESHKLLDQQQQLCAITQKKIEELEEKKEEEPKKSWWKFWK